MTEHKIPLVLLHGIFGGPSNWEGILPFLPASCQPYPLEIPFFGDEVECSTVPLVTKFVQDFIDKENLKGIIFLGNSIGGHVAVHLAIDNPGRVSGLILAGSSGLFERGFTKIPGTRPSREWVRDRACEIFYDPSHVTEKGVDEIMEIITNRKKGKKLLELVKSAKRDNITEQLKLTHCPVLLVWGRQDSVTPPDVAEQFHTLLPNSELAWIDKSGHAPMIEQPEEFVKLMLAWCHRHFLTEEQSFYK